MKKGNEDEEKCIHKSRTKENCMWGKNIKKERMHSAYHVHDPDGHSDMGNGKDDGRY